MTPSRSQTSTTSLVRLASSRRLRLDSRQIPRMTPFWLTSMKTRTASTSTPAPPATTRAAPDAGAPARPLAMTTTVATAAASAAMMVAAAELEARRVQLARGHPPRGRAEQQRGDQGQQLGRDAGVPAQGPLAHGQGVPDQDGDQGQVGQHDPPPGGGDHGQQRAEHGQVGQRVDEGEQEGAGPLTGPVELRAEQGDPADHEQGDGHDVAVGQPGQDRCGVALRRAGPVAALGGRGPAAGALLFRRGQHHDADGGDGHGQQRRQVSEATARIRG